jgi:hypothetical protein
VNIWREIAADGAGLAEEDSIDGTAQLLHRFGKGDLIGANPQTFRDCFLRRFEIQQAARIFLKAVQTL